MHFILHGTLRLSDDLVAERSAPVWVIIDQRSEITNPYLSHHDFQMLL